MGREFARPAARPPGRALPSHHGLHLVVDLGVVMSEQWTIESIRDALGNPDLAQRFLSEINRAPAHELLHVFAKWERVAKSTVAAVERGRELAAREARGEELPGEWVDATDRVLAEAERIRSRGAA